MGEFALFWNNHVLSLYGGIFQVNKYQDSLDNFVKALSHFTNFKSIHDWKSDLQELVDKATPKKPKIRAFNEAEPWDCADHFVERNACPACERKMTNKSNYCPCCGQALDWGK